MFFSLAHMRYHIKNPPLKAIKIRDIFLVSDQRFRRAAAKGCQKDIPFFHPMVFLLIIFKSGVCGSCYDFIILRFAAACNAYSITEYYCSSRALLKISRPNLSCSKESAVASEIRRY